MIGRTWHGRVPAKKADAYYAYLHRTGLSDYVKTPGNRGVYVLRRDDGDVTHFLLLTFWDSLDAIRAFAGADYERARYYAEDDEFLLEREPFVSHYDVLGTHGAGCLTSSGPPPRYRALPNWRADSRTTRTPHCTR